MKGDRASADPKDPDVSVSPQLLDRILDTVLAWESPSADRSREFVDAFLSRMPAKGFRNARSAPQRNQKEILKRAYRSQSEVEVRVLHAWRTIREDLAAAVMVEVKDREGPADPLVSASSPRPTPGEGDQESLKEARARSKVDQEERHLMRTLLAWEAERSKEAPMDQEISEEPGRESGASIAVERGGDAETAGRALPTSFEPAFAILRQIPPADSCWSSIEAAVLELRALATSKQADSVRGRVALVARLTGIIEKFNEELSFLESALGPSEIETIPSASLQEASSAIDQLESVLERYAQVRNQSASSRSAERAKQNAREQLESEFDALHARWNALTVGAHGPAADSGRSEKPIPVVRADSESSVSGVPEPSQSAAEESDQPDAPGDLPSTGGQGVVSTSNDATVGGVADPPAIAAERDVSGPEFPAGPAPGVGQPASEADSRSSAVEARGKTGQESSDAVERRTDSPKPLEKLPPAEDYPAVNDIQTISTDFPTAAPESDDASREVLRALAEGDTAGAYWIARAQTAAGASPILPDWLLAAAHGATALQYESGGVVDDLLAITRAESVPGTVPGQLVALSASLRGALLAPSSGLIAWLEAPRALPGLTELAEAVRDFAGHGQALGPQEARGLQGLEDRRRNVVVAKSEARAALERATKHRFKLPRAGELWSHFLRHDIAPWFQGAADDDRGRLQLVSEQAQRWRDQDLIMNRVGAIDRELHGNRVGRIVGDARSQLLRNTWELCGLAETWCRSVERLVQQEAKGDWFQGQVSALRARCRESLVAAAQVLRPLFGSQSAEGAAARCLSYSLADLAALLALEVKTDLPERPARRCPIGEASSLELLLLARLQEIPALALDNAGRVTSDQLPLLAGALARSRSLSLREIVERWAEYGDFRHIEGLLESIPESEQEALRATLQATEDGWKRRLRQLVASARDGIEQALVDGFIQPPQRAALAAQVERISTTGERDFAGRARSAEAVLQALQTATESTISTLRDSWIDLKLHLEESSLEPEKRTGIAALIDGALDRRDGRLAEELLAKLRPILAGQEKTPDTWFDGAALRDRLAEFQQAQSALEATARKGLQEVIRELRDTRRVSGLAIPPAFPQPRLNEALRALEAWRNLKASSPEADSVRDVAAVLAYLGFDVEPTGVSPSSASARSWRHFSVRMSAGGSSLVPQFGSQSMDRYDVVCIWERPGGETIAGWLDKAGIDSRPVLVLYLARLSGPPRKRLYEVSVRRLPAILVVDEALVLHLAGELDKRLPAMMACTLPYSSITPYTPFQAGEVPPEMFYGRRAVVEELARFDGPCLLYGGRQLGKSAALRAVERRVHRPEREEHACVIDIKLVGDPAAGKEPEQLWPKLREALKAIDVLHRQVVVDQPDPLLRHVREWLGKGATRRLLVMFDEADSFLDADARSGFPGVTKLRELMTETQRRFKVIFTGLHNVQRFDGIPNQPLAHFGGMRIEPLEADEAYRLVERPFHHLGYRFEDRAAILRVLSYTNYHPGLVQLFCKYLLDRLRERRDEEPPHKVSRADVEAVYRDARVQQEIRTRLDWTLALDSRYQAIAWSLVYQQLGSQDGYARAYSRGELLSLLRDLWPLGFGALTFDDLTGLLEEMCGLGVLIRSEDGRYRLRSPNLVRLMGTEEDVVHRLGELAKAPRPVAFDADSHHALLQDSGLFSPLTHAQDRQVVPERSGVSLIFASEALGGSLLPKALKRLRRDEEQDGRLLELPPGASSSRAMLDHLEREMAREVKSRRHFCYQWIRSQDPLVSERIAEAVRYCQRVGRGAILRVIFLLDPEATYAWFGQPTRLREELEQTVDASVAPERWGERGVRQWLEHRDKVAVPRVVESVLEATGGWLPLLRELIDRATGRDDLVEVSRELGAELANGQAPIAVRIRGEIGLEPFGSALSVLRGIHTVGAIPEGDVSPGLFDDEEVSQEELSSLCEFLIRMRVLDRNQDGCLRAEPLASRLYFG